MTYQSKLSSVGMGDKKSKEQLSGNNKYYEFLQSARESY